jgi:hypothetical protein
MSLGACMSVLIAMISAPLPGAEHAARVINPPVTGMGSQRANSRLPRFFSDTDWFSPQKRMGAFV